MAKETTNTTKSVAAPTDMEYVEIPAKDLFDVPFGGFWNNKDHYGPGTHLVSAEVAAHLRERLEVWRDEQIRQLRPNADKRVTSAMQRNG
jgi:hypothetical protein